MRFSFDQAAKAGLITREEAARGEAARSARRRSAGRTPGEWGAPRRLCALEGDLPQEILWRGVCRRWPGTARWEYRVPGSPRRYRIDVAFPADRLAVELDGWRHHGKYKQDFQRDRERQNALTLAGWRILRFYPGQIHKDLDGVLDCIAQALAANDTQGAVNGAQCPMGGVRSR